jgi:DoxX-like protein
MPELKNSNAVVTSRGMFWTGWVLTGFVGLFLLVDGGARLAGFAQHVEGMTKFGYAASLAPWIGLVLLLSTIVMLIPQTAGRFVVAGTVPTRCARAGPHSVPHRLSMIRRPRRR